MARLLTLVVFVVASVAHAAVIDGVKGDFALELSTYGLLIVCFAAGWVIGSWASIGLAIFPMLAAIPFGDLSVDRGDVYGYAVVIAFWQILLFAPALLLGTGLRKLAQRNRAHPTT